jgi:hypothetical protein
VHLVGLLDAGDQQRPRAVGLGDVDRETDVDVRGVTTDGLPSTSS